MSRTLQVGDKILARTTKKPHYYEAKVIEIVEMDGKAGYKIHYQGWHKRHDEVILENELPERTKIFSEEELKAAKELEAAARGRARERGSVEASSEEEDNESVLTTKVKLPQSLKAVLCEDYHHIHSKNLIYKVPAENTVKTVIQNYVQFLDISAGQGDGATDIKKQQIIIKGLIDFFDNMLASDLLYKNEKHQLEELKKREGNKFKPSDFYGFTHLIRMLGKFDQIIEKCHFELTFAHVVINTTKELVAYLSKHIKEYFSLEEYIPIGKV